MNRNLWLLTLCQGLFLTNNVAFIAVNGLVGLHLAPYGWMATLPIMAYVLGGALAAPIVGWTQKNWGRKVAFQCGLLVAALSALLCCYALWIASFWLLFAATLVAGYFNANAQLYRFAAAELTGPEGREKAVSWVLAGGLIGAVFGPNLASWTRPMLSTPYLGVYLSLAVLALVSMFFMAAIRFPKADESDVQLKHSKQNPAAGDCVLPARSTLEIMRQPLFIVATLCAALGYGVMSLLMAATPIAMQICGYNFDQAAWVIEWHVIGMFAPGFFTGHLIKRFGVFTILFVGLLLNLACVILALSGVEIMNFMGALFLLGVGWNFLFTASTSLLMQSYRPEEKDQAQSANNSAVFSFQVLAAFASGALVSESGWSMLNWGALIPIALMGAAIAYLFIHQRNLKETS